MHFLRKHCRTLMDAAAMCGKPTRDSRRHKVDLLMKIWAHTHEGKTAKTGFDAPKKKLIVLLLLRGHIWRHFQSAPKLNFKGKRRIIGVLHFFKAIGAWPCCARRDVFLTLAQTTIKTNWKFSPRESGLLGGHETKKLNEVNEFFASGGPARIFATCNCSDNYG